MHKITTGEGFDVVFDATGSSRAMERGFDYVAHGGRYVLVSVVKDAIRFMDPDFHKKELTLYGSRNATAEDFERVVAALRDGSVPVERLITHRTTLRGCDPNSALGRQQIEHDKGIDRNRMSVRGVASA